MPVVNKRAYEMELEFSGKEVLKIGQIKDDMTRNSLQYMGGEALKRLGVHHAAKIRQIENAFQKMYDNMTKQVLDMPVDECVEEYVKFMTSSKKEFDDEDKDLTSLDYDNDLEIKHPALNNLTSTVKRVSSIKLDAMKQRIESAINEQSMIINNDDTPIKADKGANYDSLAVRIVFFLKNLNQVSCELSELASIDLNSVHEKCQQDMKLLVNACHRK